MPPGRFPLDLSAAKATRRIGTWQGGYLKLELIIVKHWRNRTYSVVFVVVLSLSYSCTGTGDSSQEQSEPAPEMAVQEAVATLPPAVMALVDSANALVRADRHEEALNLYREAIAAAPESPIPWFGVSMVARQMGNTALVDSAQAVLDAAAGREETMSPHTVSIPEGHPATKPPGG